MARDGTGAYSLPGADFTNGTLADADEVMEKLDDIATALTQSLAKDGQTTPTASLPMGNFNHTGVGAATARTHYARASQVADSSLTYGGVAGGTADALTITLSPAISAYAIGQRFQFKVSGSANTGAATLNVNSVGAGAVTWPDGTALVAADLPANAMVEVIVQATTPVFHLASVTRAPGGYLSTSGGTVNGNITGTGNLSRESTDAGASAGPTVTLYRNSATPAASDEIGEVKFDGEDSAGNTETYARQYGVILDPTSTSEDAELRWSTVLAGTLANRLRLGAGLYTAGATGSDKGVDTINASALYAGGVLQKGPTLLQTLTPSGAATAVFTAFAPTLYSEYWFIFHNATVSVDDNYIQARVSIDGGSNYRSTAGDYNWSGRAESEANTTQTIPSSSATFFPLLTVTGTTMMGNAAGEKGGGMLKLRAPDAGNKVFMRSEWEWASVTTNIWGGHVTGWFDGTNDDVDSIQFSPGAGGGTFSATIYCIGIPK